MQPIDISPDVGAHGTPETEAARRELGRAIAQAAAELSEDQRAAFVLAELYDFSISEVADALQIPPNTAKTRLFRAREALKQKLVAVRRDA